MALGSLVLSIVTIILFFFKVDDNSVVNSDTFVSACTAVITIGVTLAIGFQVFQALDLRAKLSEIEKLKQDLETAKTGFLKLSDELKSSILYNESDRKWNEGDLFHAITKLQEAIDISLRSELNREYIPHWVKILKIYVSSLGNRQPEEDPELEQMLINNFINSWNLNTTKLQNNPNFWIIADNYREIQTILSPQIIKLTQK